MCNASEILFCNKWICDVGRCVPGEWWITVSSRVSEKHVWRITRPLVCVFYSLFFRKINRY